LIRRTTLVWSILTIAALALEGRLELLDTRPGGTAFSISVRPVFMAAFVVGVLLAWRWEIVGGIVAAFTAAGLATFASHQLEPLSATVVVVAFAVPGALWVLLDLHDKRAIVALGALVLVAASIATGGAVSAGIYDDLYGPSHPASNVAALPDSALEWVWSGGVTDSSATVVARLADDATSVRLAVGRRDDMVDARFVSPALVDDHRVVRFVVDGLSPATSYHYAVEVDGSLDRVRTGRFATFPTGPGSFRVAIGGCARVGSNGAVFDAIRTIDPILFLIAGDWHYANLTGNDLGDVREVLDYTLSRPAQDALYRAAPVAYVWDDHDYGGNNADSQSSSRPAAMAAYREYVPSYPLAGDDAPIYQAFTIGRVRFLLTDTRSARSPASAPDDASKTMLGAEQKAWLEAELSAASGVYPVIVWVNPDPWIGPAEAGGDGWAGYDTERRELADFIADHGIEGLVMVSGDAHMVAIDDGTNSDYSSAGGAGFPVLHAAALDRPGHLKGGPYSHGAVAGGGQFGVLEIEDDGGDTVTVHLSGRNWRGETLLAHTFEQPVPPRAPTP
jgi:phosphodiesterase/alkaline phosphatase D-like protein